MSSANVYFVDFEKVNIYFRKFDVWSEAHYDYVRGMVTNYIKYLFKQIWFFVFQIKIKNKKQTSNLNSNVQLFWKSEKPPILMSLVFCLNFSIETTIKTLFLISYFNLSKTRTQNIKVAAELNSVFSNVVKNLKI